MKSCRLLLLSFLVLALGGCAGLRTTDSQPLLIDTIKVVNQTRSSVDNFRLEVPATGGVVATNRILPGRAFSNGVEPFPYQGNGVVLKWTQAGKVQTASVLGLAPPPPENGVAAAVILFREQGGPVVTFEQ